MNIPNEEGGPGNLIYGRHLERQEFFAEGAGLKRVYLDYNATTPVDPEVAGAVISALRDVYGNPSSIHAEGRAARGLLDEFREDVAGLLNCDPDEIVFTGSGSESNNLAIMGVAGAYREKGSHLITSRVEHPSIIKTFSRLEDEGWRVTWLDVDEKGGLDLDVLKLSISSETVLISLMMANNETGVMFPVKEVSSLARERGILFHTDAVQAVGKVAVDAYDLGIDLLSLAGHKFYAPKGVGALYVRKGVTLQPLINGGGQEFGRRGGTENIAGIAGLAAAARISGRNISKEMDSLAFLRSVIRKGIEDRIGEVDFIGDYHHSLPNTLCISFRGISGESLVMALDIEGIAVSAGSACSSGAITPSHVLSAMGHSEATIQGAVRISLGRWTAVEEINAFLEVLPVLTDRLRKDVY